MKRDEAAKLTKEAIQNMDSSYKNDILRLIKKAASNREYSIIFAENESTFYQYIDENAQWLLDLGYDVTRINNWGIGMVYEISWEER